MNDLCVGHHSSQFEAAHVGSLLGCFFVKDSNMWRAYTKLTCQAGFTSLTLWPKHNVS